MTPDEFIGWNSPESSETRPFGGEQKRADVCRVLLASVNPGLSDKGTAQPDCLSANAEQVLSLANAIACNQPIAADIEDRLARTPHAEMAFSLLVAMATGQEAITAWVKRWSRMNRQGQS